VVGGWLWTEVRGLEHQANRIARRLLRPFACVDEILGSDRDLGGDER
jgi:hypothetical protein